MSYPYLETGRSHILAPLRAGCGSRSAGMLAKVGRYCTAQHHEDSPEIPRDIRRYYTMQKFRQLMEKTERLEVKPKALILCIPQSLLAGKVGIILPVPPPTSKKAGYRAGPATECPCFRATQVRSTRRSLNGCLHGVC